MADDDDPGRPSGAGVRNLEFPVLAFDGQWPSRRSGRHMASVEISAESAVALINLLPKAERRRHRQRARYLAGLSRGLAHGDETRALTSAAIGTIGAGFLVSALVAMATAPFSLPFLLPLAIMAGIGALAMIAGLLAAHAFQSRKGHHLQKSEIFDALAEEILP